MPLLPFSIVRIWFRLRYNMTATLPRFPVPVRVVAPDRDPLTPPEAGARISAAILGARLHTLAPARHYGFFEHKEEFARTLAQCCAATEEHAMATAPSRLGV